MFEELHRKMNRFWNSDRTLEQTDPQFIRLFSEFAYDEVVHEPAANDPRLDDTDRSIAIMAAIIGAQGMDAFDMMLPVAYGTGVSSIQLKEIIYQANAYVGLAHALPYLKRLNAFLEARNVALPLEDQTQVADGDLAERGAQERRAMFGERAGGVDGVPEHVDRWISAYCFGAYHTRSGLSRGQRAMVAACLLMGQGGCDAQLGECLRGNLVVGNDGRYLVAVISQCLPYVGFPRALDALACLRGVVAESRD